MTAIRADWRPPAVDDVGSPLGRHALKALGLRPVLMSEELARQLADRVDWGDPDPDGWYTPTFYRTNVYTEPPPRDPDDASDEGPA